VINHVF